MTYAHMASAPIFIGGPHRSGTGMVRAVLGSNSQLALPPREYQFFERFRPAPGPDARTVAEASLAEILLWPKVRQFGLPSLVPETMLAGSDHGIASIYAAPLKAYARMAGKPRFGEKTPYLERHFETLLDWFGPGLRFVHIIRDPLPTYISLCHQFGDRQPLDPLRFAWRWRASLLRGLDHAARYPDQYMLVRYEKFTADPAGWTARLCDFCALPQEVDRMVAMRDFARKRNSSFTVVSPPPAGTHSIARADTRHVEGISRIERRVIERELKDMMHPETARLPDDRNLLTAMIAAEDSPRSSATARLATLWTRIRLRLRKRELPDRIQ